MTKVECDHCGAQRSGASPVGWASVHVYATKVRPGQLGDSRHLDLCPACVGKAGLDRVSARVSEHGGAVK